MDPLATWDLMHEALLADGEGSVKLAVGYALDLAEWLNKGGAFPEIDINTWPPCVEPEAHVWSVLTYLLTLGIDVK